MLSEYYFNEKDYELFSSDKVGLNTKDIREERLRVQQKLFDINDDIKEVMISKGLHNHWRNENITSLTFPCDFNKWRVDWLGIRYGRSLSEIAQLNYGLGNDRKEDKKGFQKYSCFQLSVNRTGIDMGIYHAVPSDSVDRMALHEKIDNIKMELIEAIKEIQGYGFSWQCFNTGTGEYSEFRFDDHNPEEFIDYYKRNDKDGCYSSLIYHIPRKDSRIKSIQDIENTFLSIVDILLNFYRLTIWEIKKSV